MVLVVSSTMENLLVPILVDMVETILVVPVLLVPGMELLVGDL
jgi:hypothetical protein